MDELLITKDKKSEWIKKYGGKKGLEFLSNLVKELENELIMKEETRNESVENVTETPAAESTEIVTQITKETEAQNIDGGKTINLTEHVTTILKSYTSEVVNPIYEALYKAENAMAALEKENGELRTSLNMILSQLTMQKQFVLFEELPQDSFANLVKQRDVSKKDVLAEVTFVNKADENIKKEKPVEGKAKTESSGLFAGFLTGN